MTDLYPIIRPLLMRMDAERAHRLVLGALRAGFGPRRSFVHPALETTVFGRTLPNPLGLAAGFDKDAEVMEPLFNMGFGFVEAGTVTPLPQPGNPRPRVFRDIPNESVVNRMGFPGQGLDAFERNFRAFKAKYPGFVVGANIGINKDEKDPLAAYGLGLRRLADVADYVAVNVSSPNTAGLRDLQARDELDRLLAGLMPLRGRAPLLLKIAPDLSTAARADIAALALKHKIDGLIVSNTTVERPAELASALRTEKGGLSGRLLKDLSTGLVRDMYGLTAGQVPIIGVGGVSSAKDAYEKIRAGASLVQVYTALVFRGPALAGGLLGELARMLMHDGFAHVADAVGADAGRNAVKAAGQGV